jgi:hypothetical protein
MMSKVEIAEEAGTFAENKDVAREIREKILRPALQSEEEVEVSFAGVTATTQSFVHALVSQLIRDSEGSALDYLKFTGCNSRVKSIIAVVSEYSQLENPQAEESP